MNKHRLQQTLGVRAKNYSDEEQELFLQAASFFAEFATDPKIFAEVERRTKQYKDKNERKI